MFATSAACYLAVVTQSVWREEYTLISACLRASMLNTVYLATLALSIAVYRLSQLHPLYYYPGPLLCRLTNWKLVSVAAGGKQHLWFRRMHEKYGPIVRLGMY